MSDDKKQNSELEDQQPLGDFREESFKRQITSNASKTSEVIPPFTTGDGDNSGGESSSSAESSKSSQSSDE